MKKYILSLLVCITFSTIYGQKSDRDSIFILKGRIPNYEGAIYLSYINSSDKYTVDSFISNGSFFFSGKIKEPSNARLSLGSKELMDSDSNVAIIWIEPKLMKVNVRGKSFKHVVVQGSKTQLEYNDLTQRIYKNSQLTTGQLPVGQVVKQFAIEHPKSYIVPLQLWAPVNLPIDTINMLFEAMPKSVQESWFGKKLKAKLTKSLASAEGKPLIFFTSTDYRGNRISTSDFKGKYLLLDFWASWCIPCRKSMPDLIDIYTKYHERGLEIIAVSIDENEDLWVKAIENDRTAIWNHVLSKSIVDTTDIHRKYAVSIYPTKILISPEGIIIQRYYGTQSDVRLAEDIKKIFK